MPDFEALIRHQQTQRKPSADRLKVVKPVSNLDKDPISDGKNLSSFFFGFLGGILGSYITAGLVFFLYIKGLINFDFLL